MDPQYIFVNMFTGVVVENFSYVFQMTGGSRDVTRQQMRAFKKVWAHYANQRTGYLERNKFAEFFHVRYSSLPLSRTLLTPEFSN